MQGNFVQGRIHWWETNRAVPRLLSGIEAGVIDGIQRTRRLVLLGTLAGLILQEARAMPDGVE